MLFQKQIKLKKKKHVFEHLYYIPPHQLDHQRPGLLQGPDQGAASCCCRTLKTNQ